MKCPRCVQRIHRAAEACPLCAFHISDADSLFQNTIQSEITGLTDAAGIFRRHDRILLNRQIGKFEAKFPNLHLTIYTNPHSNLTDTRLLSFWILNRILSPKQPKQNPETCGLLILIDPNISAASISFGYQLENYFTEKDSFESLSRAYPHWLEGNFTEGLTRAISNLTNTLEKRSQQALKANPTSNSLQTHQ